MYFRAAVCVFPRNWYNINILPAYFDGFVHIAKLGIKKHILVFDIINHD